MEEEGLYITNTLSATFLKIRYIYIYYNRESEIRNMVLGVELAAPEVDQLIGSTTIRSNHISSTCKQIMKALIRFLRTFAHIVYLIRILNLNYYI